MSDSYSYHLLFLLLVAVKSKSPYSTLITHGFLLDEKGYKMSKSLGNTIVPSLITQGGKVCGFIQAIKAAFCVRTLRGSIVVLGPEEKSCLWYRCFAIMGS